MILSGSISSSNISNANRLQSSLQNALSNNSIAGINILSSSVGVYYNDGPITTNSQYIE